MTEVLSPVPVPLSTDASYASLPAEVPRKAPEARAGRRAEPPHRPPAGSACPARVARRPGGMPPVPHAPAGALAPKAAESVLCVGDMISLYVEDLNGFLCADGLTDSSLNVKCLREDEICVPSFESCVFQARHPPAPLASRCLLPCPPAPRAARAPPHT